MVNSIRAKLNTLISLIEFKFSNRRLNIWKTIWINFRSLPFNQALGFPIYVYGGLRIVSLAGNFIIRSEIKRGMIKFGIQQRYEITPPAKSLIMNNGTVVFNGATTFLNGCSISTNKPDSVVEIGEKCYFAENITIKSEISIVFGSHTRVAYDSMFMDSDFHYIIDEDTREIFKNKLPIIIGDNNWIGANTRALKGAVTPNNTIVLATTLLNKNFENIIPENSIMGGTPAKLIKTNRRRVFNVDNEKLLNCYFENNTKYILDQEIDINKFCI